MKRKALDVLRHALGSRIFVLFAVAVGVLLASPSITGGLASDDHIQRTWVKDAGQCLDLFTFANGDEAAMRFQKSAGTMPWYTDDRLKISFFRPLASLSHCLDYRYLDAFPALLHVENLLWLGAAIWAASALFRRTASAPWIAGLATLLFAIDEAHGQTVGWLANRNSLMATTFGLLALTLHHRARAEGSRRSLFFAVLAFLAALFSAEAAIAVVAYLVAHALFLDEATLARRLRALLPYLAALVAWRVVYARFDHGQYGSALYTDPVTQPLRFLSAVWERGPVLLFAQLGGPPADLFAVAPLAARKTAWLVALAVLSTIALVLAPWLRRRAAMRFFALAMLSSVIPACATVPGDRLLMFVGVGGMGLVAELIGGLVPGGPELPRSFFFRAPGYVLALAWTVLHLVLAPLRLPTASTRVGGTGEAMKANSESLFAKAEPMDSIVVLSADNMYSCTFATFMGYALGHANGAKAQCLFAGEGKLHVLRVGASRLVLRPEHGFIDLAREPFWNADAPMRVGDVIDLGWLKITVTEVSQAGEPREAMFHFAASLDDPKLRLRYWSTRENRYLDAPSLPIWGRLTMVDGDIVDLEKPGAAPIVPATR